MSHRSGETEDATIADLSGRDQLRARPRPGRWRARPAGLAHNQPIRIEEELDDRAHYAGAAIFA